MSGGGEWGGVGEGVGKQWAEVAGTKGTKAAMDQRRPRLLLVCVRVLTVCTSFCVELSTFSTVTKLKYRPMDRRSEIFQRVFSSVHRPIF